MVEVWEIFPKFGWWEWNFGGEDRVLAAGDGIFLGGDGEAGKQHKRWVVVFLKKLL